MQSKHKISWTKSGSYLGFQWTQICLHFLTHACEDRPSPRLSVINTSERKQDLTFDNETDFSALKHFRCESEHIQVHPMCELRKCSQSECPRDHHQLKNSNLVAPDVYPAEPRPWSLALAWSVCLSGAERPPVAHTSLCHDLISIASHLLRSCTSGTFTLFPTLLILLAVRYSIREAHERHLIICPSYS